MNEVQRAIINTVIRLIGARRWPSGRLITADERRYMASVLVLALVE